MPSFPYWVVLTSSNISKKYVFCRNDHQVETVSNPIISRGGWIFFLQVTKHSQCIKKLTSSYGGGIAHLFSFRQNKNKYFSSMHKIFIIQMVYLIIQRQIFLSLFLQPQIVYTVLRFLHWEWALLNKNLISWDWNCYYYSAAIYTKMFLRERNHQLGCLCGSLR